MRSNKFQIKILLAAGLALISASCSQTSSTAAPPAGRGTVNGYTIPNVTGPNVMTFTVDGTSCLPLQNDDNDDNGSDVSMNEPCVSVTICPPGSASSGATNCQTISGILLDTGSVGLRVFTSVLNSALVSALTTIPSGGGILTECMQYGGGTADWGPVASSTLFLGGEPGVTVPIQLINSTYGGSGASNGWQICNTAAGGTSSNIALDQAPIGALGSPGNPGGAGGTGFNGILGIGLTPQDCGTDCESSNSQINQQFYYSCTGTLNSASTCSSAFQQVTLANQLQQPIASLSADNNGEILELPNVGMSGSTSLNGFLVFGIGTETNNAPASGIVTIPTGQNMEMTATFNGSNQYPSFIDSGSNLYYIPTGSSTSGLVNCAQFDPTNFPASQGWLCTSGNTDTNVGMTVTEQGTSGSSQAIAFYAGNPEDLFTTSSWVFNNVANDSSIFGQSNSYFDLGLPFYIGRNVYHGFVGASSSLGSNGYWAF